MINKFSKHYLERHFQKDNCSSGILKPAFDHHHGFLSKPLPEENISGSFPTNLLSGDTIVYWLPYDQPLGFAFYNLQILKDTTNPYLAFFSLPPKLQGDKPELTLSQLSFSLNCCESDFALHWKIDKKQYTSALHKLEKDSWAKYASSLSFLLSDVEPAQDGTPCGLLVVSNKTYKTDYWQVNKSSSTNKIFYEEIFIDKPKKVTEEIFMLKQRNYELSLEIRRHEDQFKLLQKNGQAFTPATITPLKLSKPSSHNYTSGQRLLIINEVLQSHLTDTLYSKKLQDLLF